MQSPNNTLIVYGQWITDDDGNTWTITSDGRVAVNYVPDPTTANVTHLAYKDGVVWQENSSNLWWSKTSPSASWGPPTSTPPVAVVPSPDPTLVGIAEGPFMDADGNVWSINSIVQVECNGVADTRTVQVTHLAYVGGVVWYL